MESELTENRITMIMFTSFPEPRKRDFKIGRGRPKNVRCNKIMEYMNLRKTYVDVDETKHNKRKNEKNEGHNKVKKKNSGENNERNVCRPHGTHPWSECCLNPQSRNHHMNPRSPFYRGGGRTSGRGDGGRGRFQARGRGNDFSGRGGAPQQHTTHHGSSQGDNCLNDRGSNHGQDRVSSGNNYNYGIGTRKPIRSIATAAQHQSRR